MAYEHKPGQFSLFKNKYHESGDTKPVMKGDGICPCCEAKIELAIWGKQDRNGNKYFSGKMQPPKDDHQNERPKAKPAREEIDDEIPF